MSFNSVSILSSFFLVFAKDTSVFKGVRRLGAVVNPQKERSQGSRQPGQVLQFQDYPFLKLERTAGERGEAQVRSTVLASTDPELQLKVCEFEVY